MPRKRRKKRQNRVTQPVSPPPEKQVSAAALKVVEKISSTGTRYLEDNFERIMLESFALAKEPEFADLSFDSQKTVKANLRFAEKYKDRLEVAAREGSDKHHQVFDEMRIEIIEALVTPLFRKEVFRCLGRLIDRLMAGTESQKLEMALALKPIMQMKKIPWGINGLILGIYDRTLEPARRSFEEEEASEEILGDLVKALRQGRDPGEIIAKL